MQTALVAAAALGAARQPHVLGPVRGQQVRGQQPPPAVANGVATARARLRVRRRAAAAAYVAAAVAATPPPPRPPRCAAASVATHAALVQVAVQAGALTAGWARAHEPATGRVSGAHGPHARVTPATHAALAAALDVPVAPRWALQQQAAATALSARVLGGAATALDVPVAP